MTAGALSRSLGDASASVALVGPHGGGKSLYRAFRYRRHRNLPLYLQHALGVRSSGLGHRAPERFESRLGWCDGSEAASDLYEEFADFLEKRTSTPAIYRHVLAFPSVAGAPVHRLRYMLDFPGECLRRPDLPPSAAEVLDLLAGCRVVLFMIPFWILVPRRHREIPTALELEMARALRPEATDTDVAEQRTLRDRALYESAAAWLDLTEQLLARGRSAPTVIVALTMLGDDFVEEIRKESREGVPVVEELRGLWRGIRTPAANGAPVWDVEAWRGADVQHQVARALARRVLPPWNAGAIRQILYRVDASARAFLAESRLEGDRAVGVYDPAPALAEKLLGLSAASSRTRYVGINVVSERRMLVRGDSQYLLEEPRGTLLPELYFSASLDLLR